MANDIDVITIKYSKKKTLYPFFYVSCKLKDHKNGSDAIISFYISFSNDARSAKHFTRKFSADPK